MVADKSEPAGQSDREIVLSRVFEATREVVWQAWTQPEHLANWWGPRGFTITTQHMDVRVGGEWQYVMHGPDGHDYDNRITYLAVDKPASMTYKHGGDADGEPVSFQTTVTFEPISDGAQTRVTMRALFASPQAREFVIKNHNAVEGGKQTFDRLGEYLPALAVSAKKGVGAHPFVITRVLPATVEEVWHAWTDVDALVRWFGPTGTTMPSATLDLRPEGTFHYCLQLPDESRMWGKWTFREVVPQKRLVTVVSFSDESGGITRAPFDPYWPLETLSVLTIDPHAGISLGTVMRITWSALNATPPEQATFDASHASMQQGWSGTLDQLVAYLSKS